MSIEIDTSNDFAVGVQGKDILILRPPRGRMTKDEAFRFAAWIVALVEDNDEEFQEILDAVRGT